MDATEVLANCFLFQRLSRAQLARIAPLCSEQSHEAGETVFVEGGSADHLYVVVTGKVALETGLRLGSHTTRRATIGVVGECDTLGWSALVEPYKLTSSGVCLEPVRLIAIDAPGLRGLMAEDLAIGYQVASRLATVVSSRLMETRETLMYFLSIVAHELKSPLAAIESYVELMLEGFSGPISERQRGMLSRSSIRIREALDLLDDLLDVQRLHPSQIVPEIEPTDLRSLLESALESIRRPAEEKSITVELVAPPEMEPVPVSPSRFRQVLVNLLSNAVKYTPAGGRVAARVAATEDSAVVEVLDTGIGIPAEDLPHIFDDFYRAGNVTEKGAGLGLSIARKIVAAHQGRIWAESPCTENPDGGGSKFTVVLPKRKRMANSE